MLLLEIVAFTAKFVVKVNYVGNDAVFNAIFLISSQNGGSGILCMVTSLPDVRSRLIFSPFEQFNCRKENNYRDYSNYSEVYHCPRVVSVDHDIV
jgi:hypothetical protein